MRDLVGLDLPLGPQLFDELRRCYDRGEAVTVLDRRLQGARRDEILNVVAPTVIIDETGNRHIQQGRPVEDGDGLVVTTSGSSGKPKAAVLTWEAVHASAERTMTALQRERPTVWNACLPATHVGGFAVLARALLTDASIYFGDPDDLAAGATNGATHVAVVRTQLHRADLSAYDVVLLGGGPPPDSRPDNVVTTWGMTETGSGVVYDGQPLPDVRLAEKDGEILVASPTLFRTYRHAPAPLIQGPDGRRDWFPTGDAGTFENGQLTIRGRIGYVITTGGEKVWPEDLESALGTVAGIDEIAVTGAHDDEWGQRIVAFVVTSSDTDSLWEQCREAAAIALGPWAKPKEFRRVASLPRTSNGKLRRDELARWV